MLYIYICSVFGEPSLRMRKHDTFGSVNRPTISAGKVYRVGSVDDLWTDIHVGPAPFQVSLVKKNLPGAEAAETSGDLHAVVFLGRVVTNMSKV